MVFMHVYIGIFSLCAGADVVVAVFAVIIIMIFFYCLVKYSAYHFELCTTCAVIDTL